MVVFFSKFKDASMQNHGVEFTSSQSVNPQHRPTLHQPRVYTKDSPAHFRVGRFHSLTRRPPSIQFPSLWQVCTPNRTRSEVPARSASMGSADLWRRASTRFTSPICLLLHVTSHSVRGPPPREIINDLLIKQLLSIN